MSDRYFEVAYSSFLEAIRNTEVIDRFYNVAGCHIHVRYAGEGLLPYISPALEHLAVEQIEVPSLSICLFSFSLIINR